MKLLSLLTLIVVIVSSCTGPSESEVVSQDTEDQTPEISSEKTKEVIEHHLQALAENDLEMLLSDYTEESVFFTQDSTFYGLDQIQGFMQGVLPLFPIEGTEFIVDKMAVDDEIGFIVWHASTPVINIPFGTDTYVIEDGKIIIQTFAGVLNPVETED